MGITLSLLERLATIDIFAPKMSIMDIGSSNLYSAPAKNIVGFVRRFAPEYVDTPGEETLDQFAIRLEEGAGYDPVRGGVNGSWAGELFEKAGFEYSSIDIAGGYKTTGFDLNAQSLPPSWQGAFDIVINCGTTEHVFNQAHAFKTIHDLTRAGGVMVHQLPVSGYPDHGFFLYTGRFFFMLASCNGYEIIDVHYDDPGKVEDLTQGARNAGRYHAALKTLLHNPPMPVTNCGMTVCYRKMTNSPFVGPVDKSTSVGEFLVNL